MDEQKAYLVGYTCSLFKQCHRHLRKRKTREPSREKFSHGDAG